MSTNTTPTTTETTAQPTDKEKVMALFTELGIGFQQEKTSNNLVCTQGEKRIGGYRGFETVFEFEADGKFVSMNNWGD
jgi:hypothetical protein